MGIIRLNAIKHYTGTEAELPASLPYGDTYFTTDTRELFKYNQDGLPKNVSLMNFLFWVRREFFRSTF